MLPFNKNISHIVSTPYWDGERKQFDVLRNLLNGEIPYKRELTNVQSVTRLSKNLYQVLDNEGYYHFWNLSFNNKINLEEIRHAILKRENPNFTLAENLSVINNSDTIVDLIRLIFGIKSYGIAFFINSRNDNTFDVKLDTLDNFMLVFKSYISKRDERTIARRHNGFETKGSTISFTPIKMNERIQFQIDKIEKDIEALKNAIATKEMTLKRLKQVIAK